MGEMEASVASIGELSWRSRSYSSSASDSAYAVPVLKLMVGSDAGLGRAGQGNQWYLVSGAAKAGSILRQAGGGRRWRTR